MNSLDANDFLAFGCLIVSMIGLTLGGINRIVLRRGIGAQFIRYNTVVVGLPIVGALAFQQLATAAVVGLVADALAFAFAATVRDEK
jgi:hypothetical protein